MAAWFHGVRMCSSGAAERLSVLDTFLVSDASVLAILKCRSLAIRILEVRTRMGIESWLREGRDQMLNMRRERSRSSREYRKGWDHRPGVERIGILPGR